MSGTSAVEDAFEAVSKSQTAYGFLRERIARRELSPGYRLVLQSIADELDMSVVPVREAIRRLEAEGLVTYERNVGARVAMIDEHGYVDAMQALGVVEGAATGLSAPAVSAADLGRAREVNDQLRALLDHFDPHAFTALNQRFHSVLFESCPNRLLLDMVHRGWAQLSGLRDSTFAFVPGRAHASVAEHDHILDLIARAADPLEIEIAARDHRWATMQAFLDTRAGTGAGSRAADHRPTETP
ncbi:GntR family transcriptional regulator [Promicromonospora citrea]|uniref:GntR family transcriptional regulator n=1 Tax=Promicromonospora citrea TaxID=43677 RepID=A0A8H9GK40_9MICO|nr:GntR family transcriptional regulator [Promicromonospora citrea]NNH53483.1 GntR family transcriptional regulator [Promicromonospora citrea]GGM33873.1 GntR family transcriptional regulator [Promicromonospora citrea]